jgi:hypothetical protein
MSDALPLTAFASPSDAECAAVLDVTEISTYSLSFLSDDEESVVEIFPESFSFLSEESSSLSLLLESASAFDANKLAAFAPTADAKRPKGSEFRDLEEVL